MKNRNLKSIALALVVTITSLCIAACSSGSDGTPLRVDDVKSTIDIIAKNLKDIGINVSVKSYDPDNIIYTFFGNRENTKAPVCERRQSGRLYSSVGRLE